MPAWMLSFVFNFGTWLVSGAPLAAVAATPALRPVTPASIASHAWNVPALVFVSRQPAPAGSGQIPGLGPRGRALATGGRLLIRDGNGRVRPVLPEARFFDVSDPCVSWDGKRIAFAATTAPDSAWRIWIVSADGSGLAAATRSDRGGDLRRARLDARRFARYDDLDPCWLADDRIAFASTRFPQRAQAGDLPVTNLFVTVPGGASPNRITAERNGGEELTLDPPTGRIVYARWWFNRFLPSDEPAAAGLPRGITLERAHAVPQDTINLWTAGIIHPDGDALKLAAGDAHAHATMRAYQPTVLPDGSVVGVWAREASMDPAPGFVGLQHFAAGVGPARYLTGPGTALPAAACAPVALADGRLVFAMDVQGHGDFGLYLADADGRRAARIIDLPGSLELDAAVLAPRRRPPVPLEESIGLRTADLPNVDPRQLADSSYTFRFDCLNVFTNAAVDAAIPDALPIQQGLRIRFYAPLARPEAVGGDSLILLREVPVDESGAVHVDDIIAETPIFEQLVGPDGHILRSTRGAAHVAGMNFSRMGSGTKCVGCHTGHSVIPAAPNNWLAKWFNTAPSAEVWASSVGAGQARNLVDRRTRGPAPEVAWVAQGKQAERVRLAWNRIIEVRALVIYALRSDLSAGTQLRVDGTDLVFRRAGQTVKQLSVRRRLRPNGTRIEFEPVRVDAIEIMPTRVTGIALHRPVVALAEIETVARLLED